MIFEQRTIEFSHHEIAQRHSAQQAIRFRIHDVARVDRFLFTRDRANVFERVADGHLRIEPHKLRRHDAAGRVIRILKQIFQLGAHFRTKLRQDAMPFVQSHLLNDVGALVGGEAFENGGHASRFELFEDRCAAAHRRLIAELDAARERQHRNDRGGFGEIELIE